MKRQIRLTGLMLFVAALWALPIHSTIIDVPGDQPTIQAGIDAATNGDTVLVGPGTYFENVHFREKGITVASHYIVAAIAAYIDSTVINGSAPADSDSASCVRIVSSSSSTSQDTSAALIGFTITGGSGTGWNDEHGAGVYREGGGILIQYLSPRIKHNLITGNRVVNGGGMESGGGAIRCGDSNPSILNNTITGNSSGVYGGAIVLNYCGASIKNNVIAFDTSGSGYGGGGALWIYGNDALHHAKLIENNTIVYNAAVGGGAPAGGIYIDRTSAIVHNSLIGSNTGPQISGTATVTYCDVQGGYSGIGNLDVDPAFQDTLRFYLSDTSACIDAGDTSSIYNDREDPLNLGHALWPAKGLLRNDMGAYGGGGATDLPTGIQDSEPTKPEIPHTLSLGQGYPNPFGSSATIRYSIAKDSQVALVIYNVLGEAVTTLINRRQSSGSYSAVCNGRDAAGRRLGAGLYFVSLRVGKEQMSTRIILAR